ncbi:hypothetical protein JOF53_006635 [Crossiella equi]|uniref:Uncharacterized protein n=1 Tax=Crossiella equi TaxID=130796 RepID=A0ABS5AMG0_9PSEU|nr:hypothetical protein [Crossiella equi]MBP2477763.1 hypothetical protein [Crossiella equi]
MRQAPGGQLAELNQPPRAGGRELGVPGQQRGDRQARAWRAVPAHGPERVLVLCQRLLERVFRPGQVARQQERVARGHQRRAQRRGVAVGAGQLDGRLGQRPRVRQVAERGGQGGVRGAPAPARSMNRVTASAGPTSSPSARPGQGDQPVLRQQPTDLGQLGTPADEARQLGRVPTRDPPVAGRFSGCCIVAASKDD